MPVRRLNYTGRKRLRQIDCRIHLEGEGEEDCRFRAELHLDKYDLPPNGLVFVEAYRQTLWKRFRFGTVGAVRAWDEPRLSELGSPEGILFRVKVTSPFIPRGLLLAEADRIRPRRAERQEEDRMPLLPARPDESLGSQVYRVDLDDEPILLINKALGDWKALTRDQTFQALVLPAVFREILTRILRVDRYTELDDEEDWRSAWLQFAIRLPGMTEPPKEHEEERFDDWIEDAVSSFATKFRIIERFQPYWTGASER